MKPRLLGRAAAIAVAVVTLAACSDAPHYNAHDIRGAMPDLAFRLTTDQGEKVTAQRYRGDLLLLYFGYTNCPDICPATMARLRAALGGLTPDQRAPIKVLFVSVDPTRDTHKKLRRFTSSFGPEFIGLTGTQKQLRTLTKRYRVTYGYGKPNANGFYTVSHSSAIFMFDPQGRARLLANQRETVKQLTHDLSTLLDRSAQ